MPTMQRWCIVWESTGIQDEANIKLKVEAISSSNKFLKLIDESVELMRMYHPYGERYYWVLYYTYMTPHQLANISEVVNKLEPHLPQSVGVNRSTYFAGGTAP